jgi:hypothetical protein
VPITDVAQHLDQARHNAALCAALDPDTTDFVDWHITLTFYEAVHYIDAYALDKNGFVPYTDHVGRFAFVQSDLGAVYADYQLLHDLSRDARYEEHYSLFQMPVYRAIAKRLRTDELERIKQPLRASGLPIP